jgi:capsule polysaccharide export protein KpsE/RkpR
MHTSRKLISHPLLDLIFKYTIGLPFQIKAWLTSSGDAINARENKGQIIRLNKEDTELLEKYRDRISVDVDTKTGILTLSTEMPDAVALRRIAQLSIDLLTNYVTDYKVSKAKENLDFIHEQYDEAKLEFEKTQEALGLFNDRNRNVVTALAQAESQRLQNEYNLAFEVYKGLATQLEQAKIKVKEETPVFTVLEPVKVPVEKNKPRGLILVPFSIIIGLIVGMIYVMTRKWMKSLIGLLP